jgi:hypothetical protein
MKSILIDEIFQESGDPFFLRPLQFQMTPCIKTFFGLRIFSSESITRLSSSFFKHAKMFLVLLTFSFIRRNLDRLFVLSFLYLRFNQSKLYWIRRFIIKPD